MASRPGRAGRDVYGVKVYDCVRDIVAKAGGPVEGSIVSVPPKFTRDAVFEALENGIKLIVIVTENIPRKEVAQMVELAELARRPHHRAQLPRHHLARRGEDGRRRRSGRQYPPGLQEGQHRRHEPLRRA